jgi:hypothetical protein
MLPPPPPLLEKEIEDIAWAGVTNCTLPEAPEDANTTASIIDKDTEALAVSAAWVNSILSFIEDAPVPPSITNIVVVEDVLIQVTIVFILNK